MHAEHYRRNARHFVIRARRMTYPGTRALMIDIATIWMRLAELAERHKLIVQQQQQMQHTKKNAFHPLVWTGNPE
jgi:hypothetical protein